MQLDISTEPVVIVGAKRTAIGRHGGAFAQTPAHVLGAHAATAALADAGIGPSDVDEVVMGCVGTVGPDAYNARRVALEAGIPAERATAHNVNRLCGSGLEAVWNGAVQVATGQADVVVAGGNENMTRQPYLDYHRENMLRLGDRTIVDGTLSLVTDPWGRYPMGVTAEVVAERFGVDRLSQDAFALRSQELALQAIDAGRFAAQIVPVAVGGGEATVDEHPRRGVTLEKLAALRPAFRDPGTVTAGNSSGINDGAAALVLMRASRAQELGCTPRAEIVAIGRAGVAPEIMGYAPVPAIDAALRSAGLTVADIDVIELNEAFAAQALAVIRDAKLDPERVNPNGGAIALGHPVGATGAILTVKLLHELERVDGEHGIVTMCIGGGQALAAVFRRI